MLAVACVCTGFLLPGPLAPATRSFPGAARIGALGMEEGEMSEWDKYMETRSDAEMDAVESGYKSVCSSTAISKC